MSAVSDSLLELEVELEPKQIWQRPFNISLFPNKGPEGKKTTHSGLTITHIVHYDKLCPNIHHFQC